MSFHFSDNFCICLAGPTLLRREFRLAQMLCVSLAAQVIGSAPSIDPSRDLAWEIECDRRPVRADRQGHVVVHLVRGCEGVSGSSRRWVHFDIRFKGSNGIP